MKILIIDNGSLYIKQLKNRLKKYSIKVISYKKINDNLASKFNAVILSGGHQLNVKNHKKEYRKEINFIKKTGKPLFGICLGFELIAVAFGEKLNKLDKKEHSILQIIKKKNDPLLDRLPKNLEVFESHRWALKKILKNKIQPLAASKDGIEIIKHSKKPIYGVQFHPEKFTKKTQGYKILKNFLDNYL